MDSEEFSCIKKVVKTVQLSLPFMYVSNDIAGITGVLDGWKRQFVKQLKGIVVSYKNVSVVSRVAAVSNLRSYAIYNVKATFDLFCPNIGDIVKGKINRISREHIGCLIQGTINVTIHLPKVYPPELSKYIYLDREILFEIENFVAEPKVMRVTGDITEKCIELMSSLYPDAEDSVMGEGSNSSSDESTQVNLSILNSMKSSKQPNEDVKPKKLKKRQSESSTVESAVESTDKDIPVEHNKSPKKKKSNSMQPNEDVKPKKLKKRKRESVSSTVESAIESTNEDIPVESPKKKKSKNRDSIQTNSPEKSPKKKKSKINNDANHTDSSDKSPKKKKSKINYSNLTDSSDKSPKKKKSKIKHESTDSPEKSAKKKKENNSPIKLSGLLYKTPKKERESEDTYETIHFDTTAVDSDHAEFKLEMLNSLKSDPNLFQSIFNETSPKPSTSSAVNKKKRKRESSTEDAKKKKKPKKKSKDPKSSKSKDKKKATKKKGKVAASGSVLKKDKKSSKGKKSSKKEKDSKSKSSKKKSKKGDKKDKSKKEKNKKIKLETKDDIKIKSDSE